MVHRATAVTPSAHWARCIAALVVLGLSCPRALAAGPSPELPIVPLSAVTDAGQSGTPWIRVAIIRNHPQFELQIHGHFRMLALHTADPLREDSHLPRVIVRAIPEGLVVGEDIVPFFGVRIEPARDATITLNGQRLRGALEILRQADLTLLVINHIDLEEYLQGVLGKEMPFYWPVEALRTIAIAARTYALFHRLSKTSLDYDVTGDVLSQLYGGKTAEKRRTTRAVKDTEGLILASQGQVFPAFYHSTCGGVTEHASVMGLFDLEPLKGGVVCSFCRESPFYRWERRLTKADVAWALTQKGYGSVGGVEGIDVLQRTVNGRVAQLRIRGVTRSVTLTGYNFRALFGFDRLRSTAFSIEPRGDEFVLQGQGWGHGVGLCQWGAAALARRGLSAQEILAFYYPKAEIARLGDITVEPFMLQGGS